MPNRKTMTRLAGVLAAGIMACAGSAANAVVVFDNIDLTGQASTRIAASSPGALVSVAANITINQIAVRNDLNSNGNLKFLIFDHATHALLFNSGSTAFVDNGMSLKTSNPFSFTLLGGMSYDIGAIADVGGLWGFDQISNSQNHQLSRTRISAISRAPHKRATPRLMGTFS